MLLLPPLPLAAHHASVLLRIENREKNDLNAMFFETFFQYSEWPFSDSSEARG
jgi:hypothetical protein